MGGDVPRPFVDACGEELNHTQRRQLFKQSDRPVATAVRRDQDRSATLRAAEDRLVGVVDYDLDTGSRCREDLPADQVIRLTAYENSCRHV
jgi:hypothetical protein